MHCSISVLLTTITRGGLVLSGEATSSSVSLDALTSRMLTSTSSSSPSAPSGSSTRAEARGCDSLAFRVTVYTKHSSTPEMKKRTRLRPSLLRGGECTFIALVVATPNRKLSQAHCYSLIGSAPLCGRMMPLTEKRPTQVHTVRFILQSEQL